jgi:signal transduction histidine kinase
MDLTIPLAARSELAAAFFQAAITLGLAIVCIWLYERHRKPYFAWWAAAWLMYVFRLGAIISFLITDQRYWLFWHQVTTGWTALVLLWAALVFSQGLRWRDRYLVWVLFPPIWSYVAIYRLDDFMAAALPAVLFLSAATLWTAWAFYQHYRRVRSSAAGFLAGALLLWGVHHLDYPLLRARGVWNPWGYYLDIAFELAMGAGILLLVVEDLRGGVATLAALSSELQPRGRGPDVVDGLLRRFLSLPAVRGSALYRADAGDGEFVRSVGVCEPWGGMAPAGAAAEAIARMLQSGAPEVVHPQASLASNGGARHPYTAALPVLRDTAITGALLIVGDARDPFAALDREYLTALGRQVGAALENADLYRSLEGRTRELERLSQRMLLQHEDERRRLSRELHDETAQVMSAVKLELGVARERAPAGIQPQLDRALALVDTGIDSIRSVVNDLRPSLLEDLGLRPAIRALVQEFGARGSIEATFHAADDLPVLSAAAELALFRAVQEALANVARHADARSVSVSMMVEADDVVVRIRDDGKGLAPGDARSAFEERGRMGLAGMRERIMALGGVVEVGGEPGLGVDLVIRVPTAPGEVR